VVRTRPTASAAAVAVAALLFVVAVAACVETAGEVTPVAPLGRPSELRVALHTEEESTAGELVTWRTWWELTWESVPGATSYVVETATSEGGGNRPRARTIEQPEWRIEVAAGTSAPAALERDRQGQLAFTAAQLLVRVVAADDDGRRSAPSPWFPVGEVLPEGVPVPQPLPGHP
jgi:hypothetical protein